MYLSEHLALPIRARPFGYNSASASPLPPQHVLGHLWTRGYRIAAQKWEVAAAAFTHLEQVLQLATRPGLPPPLPASEAAATGAKQPPGYLIMHDLLGEGAGAGA